MSNVIIRQQRLSHLDSYLSTCLANTTPQPGAAANQPASCGPFTELSLLNGCPGTWTLER